MSKKRLKKEDFRVGASSRATHARFESLVREFSVDVFRYAFWLSKERSLAEDLTQETFLRAFRFLDRLKDGNAAKSWLFTIVRREHARLYSRKRVEITDDADFDEIEGFAGEDTSAEAFALRRALRNLQTGYREPLILQVIGGLSSADISEKLNLTRGAVLTRLFRARAMLREVLMDGDDLGLRESKVVG